MENVLNTNYGLVELTDFEIKNTEGGVPHPALVVAACVGGGIVGLGVGIAVCYLAYKYL